jgi:hypothetical protein
MTAVAPVEFEPVTQFDVEMAAPVVPVKVSVKYVGIPHFPSGEGR